jgi:hypothetical protein
MESPEGGCQSQSIERGADHLHSAVAAGSPSQACVGREQSRAEGLCECHVDGVVGCQVWTESPAAFEELMVLGTSQREMAQVLERHLGTTIGEATGCGLPSQDGGDLEVDERRSSQLFTSEPLARGVAICTVICNGWGEHARVDDDHRRARSRRIAGTDDLKDTDPPARPPARSKTSSRVGWVASSTSRPSRYSWSDCPAAAARLRRTAWTSSGTPLIWMLGMTPLWRHYMQTTSARCCVSAGLRSSALLSGLWPLQAQQLCHGGQSHGTSM